MSKGMQGLLYAGLIALGIISIRSVQGVTNVQRYRPNYRNNTRFVTGTANPKRNAWSGQRVTRIYRYPQPFCTVCPLYDYDDVTWNGYWDYGCSWGGCCGNWGCDYNWRYPYWRRYGGCGARIGCSFCW